MARRTHLTLMCVLVTTSRLPQGIGGASDVAVHKLVASCQASVVLGGLKASPRIMEQSRSDW